MSYWITIVIMLNGGFTITTLPEAVEVKATTYEDCKTIAKLQASAIQLQLEENSVGRFTREYNVSAFCTRKVI